MAEIHYISIDEARIFILQQFGIVVAAIAVNST